MDDMHFIIVNSKLPHAQLLLPELERRVSFEVFQETDEEEVWSVMEGGKDDMYIYDRCGRLAYYIPFPLSIMMEGQNVVSSAIFATYFRSPCGITCGNQSSELEDFLDHLNSTDTNTTVDTEVTPETPTDTQRSNTSEVSDITDFIDTLPASEQVINSVNVYENNFSSVFNDSDYQINNETLEYDMTNDTIIDKNDTNIDKVNELFNNLYNLLFNIRSNETKNNSSDVSSMNMTTVTESSEADSHLIPEDHSTNHREQNHHKRKPNVPKTNRNKVLDRCAEANFAVCRDWSKTRLIHAQTCCTSTKSGLKDEADSCRNFGKKRCKKIRSILKCCINTAITESTSADVITTVESTTSDMTTADFKDVVCCKKVGEDKLCRVVDTPVCDPVCPPICNEDEYIDDSTNMTK